MKTLIISVPDKKSNLVKQILKGLGVKIQTEIKIQKKPSAHDFVGLIAENDAMLMEKAITDGCEQIHPDDWK